MNWTYELYVELSDQRVFLMRQLFHSFSNLIEILSSLLSKKIFVFSFIVLPIISFQFWARLNFGL
jgi:hypothetical protein